MVALIPSHNEEGLLPAAIRSIEAQTVPVERIVVVSDNSTDGTAAIAAGWGGKVRLFETRSNSDRKAGALNQALVALLPMLDDEDRVFVMDADSTIEPDFLAQALAVQAADPTVGAVGGIFLACGEHSLWERLQASEYVRYARQIARDGARTRVLTGTATFVRVEALRAVARARCTQQLPGTGIYETAALCEDFELTLALKTLGYRCVSPKECLVHTEVMSTLGTWWRQRTRWQRGALQCLAAYGLSRTTLPYVFKQVVGGVGILMQALLLLVTGWAIWTGTLSFQPFWAAVGLVFVAERLISVWRAGPASRVIAATVLPELVYDYLLSVVFVGVYAQVVLRREGQWGIATIDQAL
jgi:cellulose synthase/poly-beta-1,6-N-acetylglucosamine synthase-like glycosyltransferase